MDGSAFKDIGKAIIIGGIFLFVQGAVFGVGIWKIVNWLFSHLSITWR